MWRADAAWSLWHAVTMSTEEPEEHVRVAVGDDPPIDVAERLAAFMAARGVATERVDDDLRVGGAGFMLAPRVIEIDWMKDGRVHALSIVRIRHHSLFPVGVFEYQHGVGADLGKALEHGLTSWADLDLPALLDATRPQPQQCSVMEMELPAKDGRPAYKRRLVFGPPARLRAAGAPAESAGDEEHCFCPCCLTTQSFDAFRPLIESQGTYGLRLYAARDGAGQPSADCRVNGQDFTPGKEALTAYAARWPFHGVEFRKQYVVIL